MKHLSGLDATFLYLETPETPMHVGSLHLIDLPEGYTGDFYEEVKKHVASRMHLAPVFQRKLALMPFELANPVWVDDDDVDLDYHVRRIILSRPGTMAQLEAYAGRLHSSLLDRSRPLWEFYVIEGLQTGQIGFYTKVHHAAIDGAAGIAIANAILDITPQPREVKQPLARRRRNEYQLGVAELMQAALTNMVAQYAKLIFYLPKAVKTVSSLVIPSKNAEGKREFNWLKNFSLGPKTPLNVSITNQRTYSTVSLPLIEVKQIAKQFGVTLNDVVIALCSGALRKYLADFSYDDSTIPKKPMIAAVPVSLREAGNTELNNQAAMMLCSMATHIKDPVERLKAIHASTSSAKESFGSVKAVIPTDYPSFGAPWLMSGLASLYGRSKIANAIPPLANVVISNVPGPQFPLYLAGAKMATYYPVSIVVHGIALNITVNSYNGALDFGLTACRRAIPDLTHISEYIVESLQEFKKVVARLESEKHSHSQKTLEAKTPVEVPPVKASQPKKRVSGVVKVKEPAASQAVETPLRLLEKNTPQAETSEPPLDNQTTKRRRKKSASA